MSSGFVPSPSTEFHHGLKFGKKIYFEDETSVVEVETNPNGSSSSLGVNMKRGSSSHYPARCQVEGCEVDLSGSKAYYYRHKVCCMHSKSPSVLVSGLEQRFCQQCSRFHQISEFDQGKRSCRRRLAGHNERRRKPQPSSLMSSRFPRISPSTLDNNGKGDNFLMESASYPKFSPRSFELVRGDQTTQFTWQSNNMETPSDFFVQGTNFHGPTRHPPRMDNYNEVTDSNCALSLLSNQTAPSVEMNHFLNFNGSSFMSQSSQGTTTNYQLPNASSWFLKGVDSLSSSEDVPDLGGRNSQTIHSDFRGEVDVSQHVKKHYWLL